MTIGMVLIAVGRFLLGGYFVFSGVRNIFNFATHTEVLNKKGIPYPLLALLAALAVTIVGGAMVALGFWPAIGAIGLVAFTVAANLLYHDFWNYSGEERMSHLNSVLTNLALIGGLLLVFATDWR